MDSLTPEQRSALMARIRCKDTGPEIFVRKLVHGMGYRYRLHRRSLPGTPNLVFPGRGKVIFVHGCFWHKHAKCISLPKSRTDYWHPHLEAHRQRDLKARRKLRALGWEALMIWKGEISQSDLADRIAEFLEHG